MAEIITGKDEWVCKWVAERIGWSASELEPCTTIGFVLDGNLICGIVFNSFRPSSRDIHLTIAADNPVWATRRNIKAIFYYVFIQLGCNRLTLTIKKKNKRARKLAEGLGFKYEGNVRCGYDGIEDAIIYGLLHRECRWLGDKEHGKKLANATASA